MDITSILSDPDLGGTTFTVIRRVFRADSGTSTQIAESTSTATGCIHPGSAETLSQLPEEDRREEFIVIYTTFALSLGSSEGITFTAPDRILWNSRAWRLVRVKPWNPFGFVQAFAVLVSDESY